MRSKFDNLSLQDNAISDLSMATIQNRYTGTVTNYLWWLLRSFRGMSSDSCDTSVLIYHPIGSRLSCPEHVCTTQVIQLAQGWSVNNRQTAATLPWNWGFKIYTRHTKMNNRNPLYDFKNKQNRNGIKLVCIKPLVHCKMHWAARWPCNMFWLFVCRKFNVWDFSQSVEHSGSIMSWHIHWQGSSTGVLPQSVPQMHGLAEVQNRRHIPYLT